MLAPGAWTRIVAISRHVKRELVEAYSIPEEAIELIYNGVDLKAFDPVRAADGRAAARRALGLAATDKVILFVGTGFRRKGLDLLILALAKMETHAKLVVIGRDGATRAYRSLARSCGVGDRVLFAGSR